MAATSGRFTPAFDGLCAAMTTRSRLQQNAPSGDSAAPGPRLYRFLEALRVLPIRSRILVIAALNIIVAVIFAAVIWDGAQDLTSARNDLRLTRDSDRLLTQVESQAGRLQSLIHRYFTQPNADLLREITDLRAE